MSKMPIESVSSRVFTRRKKWILAVLGVYLFIASFFMFSSGVSFGELFHVIFVGAICLYLTTFELRMFITQNGMVRESKTMLNKKSELLPWDDVSYVTIVKKKGAMTAYFARNESLGWKMKFSEEQSNEVQGVLRLFLSAEKLLEI